MREAIIPAMKVVAESFAWPLRRVGFDNWAVGLGVVLLLPLLFLPLLGYAIAATRAAERGEPGPPPWRISARLLSDGFWTTLAVLVTAVPFALALNPLASALKPLASGEPYAHVVAFFVVALLWGLVALLFLPHATAAFAASGAPRDMFDFPGALRRVRRDFVTWNLAAAAIVTAWAIGVACAGVLCIGFVPGAFYAILVSAHAAAALHQTGLEGPRPSTR